MITIDEMKHGRLYKKQFYAPFNLKDKRHGSLIFLLTKSLESSLNLIKNKFMINKKYFESYYIEKDITYYINHEGYLIDSNDLPYNVISESAKEELNNPYNYISALELDNFDCTNINESIDDIYDIGTPKISKGFPDFLTKIEKENLEDMIVSKGDKYFSKVSKTWSIRQLYTKDPFRIKQNVAHPDIQNKYFNTMSSKCIIPRSYTDKDSKFNLVYVERNKKIYTALLLSNHNKLSHVWLIFNNDLISLDLFINECVLEGNIEQEIVENEERKQFETGNLIKLPYTTEGYQMNKYYYRDNNTLIIFNNALESIDEAASSDTMLRKLLYKDRLRNNRDVFEIYDTVKVECPELIHRFIDLKKYKALNLFTDLHYYNNTFFKNNIYKNNKAVDIYYQFLTNMLCNDLRFAEAGYTKKNIFLNIDEWRKDKVNILDFREDINPFSVIIQKIKTDFATFQAEWNDIKFIIFGINCYMKLDISKLDERSHVKLKTQLNKLLDKTFVPEDPTDETKDSKNAIIASITDKLEDNKNIKVHNLTGKSEDITKDELVDKIEKAAATSNTEDDALNQLNTDDKMKEIISQLEMDADDTNKMTNARRSRLTQLQSSFLEKKLEGKSVRDLIEENDKPIELPETKLNIDTIDDSWEHLQFTNFDKVYNPNADILDILYSFAKKTCPVVVQDFKVEDTSTTEDLIDTWTVKMEDSVGNRFTLVFDVPKLKDSKFMILRGNEKTINGQNVLLPISKTDIDTVQIVSNYNKIFIRTYGASIPGRSCMTADLLMKALNKYEGKDITFTSSDNSEISKKYELPIDYVDLGSAIGVIESPDYIFYFNQDEIREKYTINEKAGIPVGYDKNKKEVLYYKSDASYVTETISYYLRKDKTFDEVYLQCKPSNKYYYSKASILNTTIPLIVIMGYNEGLISAMKKSKIKYDIQEKKPQRNVYRDYIKFKDGYISYDNTLSNSLLMNGLKECNTEDYMISEINTKAMFLDFLNIFGGMILSDGLDNFYELEIDPITEETLNDMKLTTDYVELCAYANDLLSDNKYVAHTDLTSNRYRSNELIAAYTYKALADSYAKYRNQLKRSNKSSMTIKRSQIIDNIMQDPTASDASILNPLLEIETMNSVTFKGLSGMNSDRSYTLDKRTYGDSMVNVLAMSTGFAGNVGVTRQATIDMNVQGRRGYIKQTKDMKDLNTTKTFCMTEALIPYGPTHDDPFRMAMGFIQNSKHGMKTHISSPQILSNGADQALPYMITNNFAFKSKNSGKVIEKTDKYMVVKYKDGTSDFIDLRDNVKKNSNAGFYTTVKLDSDLKVGQTFKANDILAYDKSFFSNQIGDGNTLAYNAGVLTKVAILNTDEGFEDSAIVTEWLSEALSSPVTVLKEVNLPKDTNILKILKKGDSVQEGDDILIFQNSYDEEDVNALLKTLSDDLDEITDLGKIPLKSKITGVIKDIKVYRTCEKEELSPSLKKLVNSVEKESSDISKIAKQNGVNYVSGLNPTYKLEQTGKVKNLEDGVKIEFYLQYDDTFSIGDKLIYYTAVKGVDKDIIKTGLEPYTDREPDEPIDSFVPLGGIAARMVSSIENVVSCNKVFIELDKCIKRKAGIKVKNIRDKVSNKK